MRAVTSRLWLGSAMSPHCDRPPIRALLARVRSCGLTHAILLRVDGLGSSVSQARRVFREAVRTNPRQDLPALPRSWCEANGITPSVGSGVRRAVGGLRYDQDHADAQHPG